MRSSRCYMSSKTILPLSGKVAFPWDASASRHPSMSTNQHFLNLYNHDFARLAVAVPRCRIADPAFNAEETRKLVAEAAARGASLVVFPELGLSAYTCDDLFHQRA